MNQDRLSRERIIKGAEEAVRKAQETLDKLTEEEKRRIEEDEDAIDKMANKKKEAKGEIIEENQPSFAKED